MSLRNAKSQVLKFEKKVKTYLEHCSIHLFTRCVSFGVLPMTRILMQLRLKVVAPCLHCLQSQNDHALQVTASVCSQRDR